MQQKVLQEIDSYSRLSLIDRKESMYMSDQNTNNLKNELKEFIKTTQTVMEKAESSKGEFEDNDVSSFADRILNLHRFSSEILSNTEDTNENTIYNARIINDLTNLPIYESDNSKENCSLMNAAAEVKKNNELNKIKMVMKNIMTDPVASEVLLDDLMVIYKELAA